LSLKRLAKALPALGANATLTDEMRQLRIELAEAQTVITELRAVIVTARNAPIDMPSPLRARVN
jgi:hypothetical protein